MPRLSALATERYKTLHDARALLDDAERRRAPMTAEEEDRYSRMFLHAEALRSEIAMEARQRVPGRIDDLAMQSPNALLGFRSWLRDGRVDGKAGEAFRALSAGSDTGGGYLLAPQAFLTRLINGLDAAIFVRRLATAVPMVGSTGLGVPALDAQPSDPDWTTELNAGSADGMMRVGSRQFSAHPLAKAIRVSGALLRQSGGFAEQVVSDRFAERFGAAQERAYLVGSGAQQPLGVFTAAPQGVPTGQDVATDNTTTMVTADGLMNARFGLKSQFQPRAQWVFHRDIAKQISKLKDSDGRFVLAFSDAADGTDMLLGKPLNLSEFAPNTATTGQYVGALGDFSHYWIGDRLEFNLLRLKELYAETDQVGFIGRYEGDGMPVVGEAFVRVTLA